MRGSRKFHQRGSNSDNFFFVVVVDGGREDTNNDKSGLSSLEAKRLLNGISLAGR